MTGLGGNYDAIVVGGGHNGLVCAAYLAMDGLRVLVAERRRQWGGMATNQELMPGVRVPALAHTLGRLRASVARDLRLREHGLSLVQPEVRAWAPQPDGRALTFWGDVGRTAAELPSSGLAGPADAVAYAAADSRMRALAAAMAVLMSRTPPDLSNPGLAEALDGLRAGFAARSRARSESGGLLRAAPMALADLLAESFESDALRAVVAARALQHTALEPRNPGTAALLIADAAGNDGGLAGQSVFARGGPAALGEALASVARALGAELRTGAEVVALRQRDGIAHGVALASGEELEAPVVVSALDPKQTLLRLVEPEVLGPSLGWRAGNVRQAGATAKVNLALRALPAFRGLDGSEAERLLRGRIVICPSMAYLERATRAGKYGRLADQPVLEATIPSLIDSGLVDTRRRRRKAQHVMSVVLQPAPYTLSDGDWATSGDELGRRVLGTLDTYAPGFPDLVEEMQVVTPLDIEHEWGATEGHALHAEAGLDQWFAWRPLHGYGRYRMPVDGLYLCGSGAHPGGGVTGGPGQLAAREVLADWARRRGRS